MKAQRHDTQVSQGHVSNDNMNSTSHNAQRFALGVASEKKKKIGYLPFEHFRVLLEYIPKPFFRTVPPLHAYQFDVQVWLLQAETVENYIFHKCLCSVFHGDL